jgi:sugar O-acyltransferase (sialic acid O-acetyltransferase NeuD family)
MNLIGNGSLAKQIKDVVSTINTYSISQKGRIRLTELDLDASFIIGFASLDDISKREDMFDKLKLGYKAGTIISPHATVSQDATIEEGGVILHHAFVGPGVLLDTNVLIGTAAVVEHDSLVGPHSVVLTGAIINGNCNIGSRCMIGSGAVLIHGIKICDDVTIGAGAVVIEDVTHPGTYVGNPARIVGVPI